MTLEIQFLPAREGDAIWLRWGASKSTHQLMVDMGTESAGLAIHERLSKLPVEQRAFELLVVTHVDGDHVGGVLTCLADPKASLEGLRFDDVWFNGWDHLHGRCAPEPAGGRLRPMGGAQGQRLSKWLRSVAWNEHFGRGPVQRADAPVVVPMPDDLTITVLGPTHDRLASSAKTWQQDVQAALLKGTLSPADVAGYQGLVPYGSVLPPTLKSKEDLERLAATAVSIDSSPSNGTSISLLIEWHGKRLLLCGDEHPDDLELDLAKVCPAPIAVDLVKLPHHGSARNVTAKLVSAISSPRWVFSTDGTTFRHPDAIAIARLLQEKRGTTPMLGFNVPSRYNGWWNKDAWREMFDYRTEYGTKADGLTIRLE